MVVLAQLVEHRIVVPSVVGSSPTFHPDRCNTISYGGFSFVNCQNRVKKRVKQSIFTRLFNFVND